MPRPRPRNVVELTTTLEVSANMVMPNSTPIDSSMAAIATDSGSRAATALPKMITRMIRTRGKTVPSALVASLVACAVFSFHIIAEPPVLTCSPSKVPEYFLSIFFTRSMTSSKLPVMRPSTIASECDVLRNAVGLPADQ